MDRRHEKDTLLENTKCITYEELEYLLSLSIRLSVYKLTSTNNYEIRLFSDGYISGDKKLAWKLLISGKYSEVWITDNIEKRWKIPKK